MKILRVFPSRTSHTPIGDYVRIGEPGLFHPKADEIHVSCIFSWDKERAEQLKKSWEFYFPNVRIGGPAYGLDGDEFVSGKYVKEGITITSRGCNFRCDFCLVPQKEGKFRELSNIAEGNEIQDNNILLASKKHLGKVFAMLQNQRAIRFVGGLDFWLLKNWHIEELRKLRIKELWFALDSENGKSVFRKQMQKLTKAGFYRNQLRCYVLAGFNEPIRKAEDRLRFAYECGALPYIQVYQLPSFSKRMAGKRSREDNLFVRRWSRPAIIKTMMEV